jgi:hypothetical protein
MYKQADFKPVLPNITDDSGEHGFVVPFVWLPGTRVAERQPAGGRPPGMWMQ